MPRVLSQDLRERVVAAIDDRMSCRAAATRFGVSAARWLGSKRCGVFSNGIGSPAKKDSTRHRSVPITSRKPDTMHTD